MSEIIPSDVTIVVKDKWSQQFTSPLSAFTGNLTELTVEIVADSDVWKMQLNKERVFIKWGDGTQSVGVTGNHTYNQPGRYEITCTAMDYHGALHEVGGKVEVTIQDYFGNGVDLSMTGTTALQGTLSPEITATMFASWQNDVLDEHQINVYAKDSGSRFISPHQYNTDRYSHFRPTWRFVKSETDQTPLENIKIEPVKLYATLTSAGGPGGSISISTTSADGSILAGLSGANTFHYIDDTPGDVELFGTLDMSGYPSPLSNALSIVDTYDLDYNYFHQKSAVLSVEVIKNTPTKLLVTSTGINGFDVGKNKWEKAPISFVVSMADDNGNIIKSHESLSAGSMADGLYNMHLGLSGGDFSDIKFYENTSPPTEYPSVFNGFLIVEKASKTPKLSLTSITAETAFNSGLGVSIIQGESVPFEVGNEEGVYNISKENENFDFAQNIRDSILQDSIINYKTFINDFLNAVFGTDTSDPETLGKTIYEKISNYTANVSDVDVGNIAAVYSMFEMIGFDIEDYRYNYPAGIKRLVDLLSINKKKLFGFENKSPFNTDRGATDTNIGDQINFSTYTLSAGTNIVAYDRYSGEYRLIQTMLNNGLSTYPLSSYSEDWGWPISVESGSADDYYDFFEYVPLSSYDTIGNVIDFDNELTLVEKDTTKPAWIDKYGIVDNMFDYRLHKGFDLFGNTKGGQLVTDGQGTNQGLPPSPTPTPSATITPTVTPTPSVTASITPSVTVTPSVTPTLTPSVTTTITPSITPSVTTTVTPTVTPTPSVQTKPADFYIEPFMSSVGMRVNDPDDITNIVFIGDKSGSMVSGLDTEQTQFFTSFTNTLQGLVDSRTELSGKFVIHLILFSSGNTTTNTYTVTAGGDPSSIINFISARSPGGGTNYNDALGSAITYLSGKGSENSVVLFSSDGDPGPYSRGQSEAETLFNIYDTKVYPILLGSSMDPYSSGTVVDLNDSDFHNQPSYWMMNVGYKGQGLYSPTLTDTEKVAQKNKTTFVYTNLGPTPSGNALSETQAVEMSLSLIAGSRQHVVVIYKVRQTNADNYDVRINHVTASPSRALKVPNPVSIELDDYDPGTMTYAPLSGAVLDGYAALWDTTDVDYIELQHNVDTYVGFVLKIKCDSELNALGLNSINGEDIFTRVKIDVPLDSDYVSGGVPIALGINPVYHVTDYGEAEVIKASFECRSKPISIITDCSVVQV